PNLVLRNRVAIGVTYREQHRRSDACAMRDRDVRRHRCRRDIDGSADVKLLPGAPLETVEGTHPEIIRPRATLEGGLGELGRVDVDRDVGALSNTADAPTTTRRIVRRVPELVSRDRIAVRVADREELRRREIRSMARHDVARRDDG